MRFVWGTLFYLAAIAMMLWGGAWLFGAGFSGDTFLRQVAHNMGVVHLLIGFLAAIFLSLMLRRRRWVFAIGSLVTLAGIALAQQLTDRAYTASTGFAPGASHARENLMVLGVDGAIFLVLSVAAYGFAVTRRAKSA